MSQHNYFEILELPVQPFVDEAVLKANYLKLSSIVHPDRETSNSVQETALVDASLVNEAQRTLSHTPSRLKHLLTLRTGSAPGNLRHVPNAIGDLFMEVGGLLQKMDAVIKEKPSEDASELSRVLFLKKSMVYRQQTESILQKINEGIDHLQTQLESLNEDWQKVMTKDALPPDFAQKMIQLYHEWTFHDRWQGQLRDRLLELTV